MLRTPMSSANTCTASSRRALRNLCRMIVAPSSKSWARHLLWRESDSAVVAAGRLKKLPLTPTGRKVEFPVRRSSTPRHGILPVEASLCWPSPWMGAPSSSKGTRPMRAAGPILLPRQLFWTCTTSTEVGKSNSMAGLHRGKTLRHSAVRSCLKFPAKRLQWWRRQSRGGLLLVPRQISWRNIQKHIG